MRGTRSSRSVIDLFHYFRSKPAFYNDSTENLNKSRRYVIYYGIVIVGWFALISTRLKLLFHRLDVTKKKEKKEKEKNKLTNVT